MTEPASWPALPYAAMHETLTTLHLELQVLGKIRVALSPPEPEWAHVPLYLTARGFSTGLVPSGVGPFEVEADMFDHQVVVRAIDGATRAVALTARPIAEFYRDLVTALDALGVVVALPPMPQEVPDPIPFPDDTAHRVYDPEHAQRFWRALVLMEPVFASYRAAFRGKVSRVQFFWGSADLNVTRYSGRLCSPPPDADLLLRGTYDMEQVSVGFWPGDESFPAAAFFAYGYPRPEAIEQAQVGPEAAEWNVDLGEFILRYDHVRASTSPHALVREFFDSVYTACATISGWDPTLTG